MPHAVTYRYAIIGSMLNAHCFPRNCVYYLVFYFVICRLGYAQSLLLRCLSVSVASTMILRVRDHSVFYPGTTVVPTLETSKK